MGVSILFQTGNALTELDLDAAPTQTHVGENEITAHPVETGTAIVDHVRVKPDKLTIEGVVSDSPLDGSNTSGLDLSGAAYQQLQAMQKAGELLQVVTSLRTYTSMVITSINVPRDSKTGKALKFTIAFEQIILVGTKTVRISTVSRAQKKVNLGAKTPQLAPNQAANIDALGTLTGFHAPSPPTK